MANGYNPGVDVQDRRSRIGGPERTARTQEYQMVQAGGQDESDGDDPHTHSEEGWRSRSAGLVAREGDALNPTPRQLLQAGYPLGQAYAPLYRSWVPRLAPAGSPGVPTYPAGVHASPQQRRKQGMWTTRARRARPQHLTIDARGTIPLPGAPADAAWYLGVGG